MLFHPARNSVAVTARAAAVGSAAAALALAVAPAVWRSGTVPYTGRRSQQLGMLWDKVQGRRSDDKLQFLSTRGVVCILPPENRDSRRVSRIGANIAAAALQGNGGGDWQHVLEKQLRFRVITDPGGVLIGAFNACCLPNGTVYISRDMLHSLDDGQLAAVLAHEVAHVIARHSAEQAALRARETHLKLLAMVVEEGHRVRRRVFQSDPEFQALRNKLHLAIKLKPAQHSQLCEYEADLIGMQLMAEACYDPRGMSKLRSTFMERERSRTTPGTKPDPLSEALGTHPPQDKRAKAVQQALPSVMEVYKAEQRSRQAGGSGGGSGWGQRCQQPPAER